MRELPCLYRHLSGKILQQWRGGRAVILDEIAAHTRLRVAKAKEALSPSALRDRVLAAREGREADAARDFEAAIARPGLSFIREVKKASPSSSLLRFAHKIPKKRLQGAFLPCKLPKQAGSSGGIRFSCRAPGPRTGGAGGYRSAGF
jgi:hypothetical protein